MDNIPCKYYEHGRENQSPLGSGEYWSMDFEDCGHPGFGDTAKEAELENYGKCNEGCPGYEPMEVAVCAKHGEYVKDWGCEACMVEEQYNEYLEEKENTGYLKRLGNK